MSDPVILYGTQSNGETLPVQVDQYGRLVAEGLPGADGEPGPPGPPGEDGAGSQLPPDPYEGALLGWLNGGLAWIGTPPIDIVEGVFGPITGYTQDGLLTIEGSFPEQVSNGVYLSQCDSQGFDIGANPNWDVRGEWNTPPDFQTPQVGHAGSYVVENIFDGNVDTKGLPEQGPRWRWIFNSFDNVEQMRIWWDGSTSVLRVNDIKVSELDPSGANPAVLTGAIQSFTGLETNHIAGGDHCSIYQIEVNNKILVYRSRGAVRGRINNVLDESNLLIVPSNGNVFTPGNYLRIEGGQRVAPWVLYGNDPTSLIDHLRSKRD